MEVGGQRVWYVLYAQKTFILILEKARNPPGILWLELLSMLQKRYDTIPDDKGEVSDLASAWEMLWCEM